MVGAALRAAFAPRGGQNSDLGDFRSLREKSGLENRLYGPDLVASQAVALLAGEHGCSISAFIADLLSGLVFAALLVSSIP